MDRGNRPWSTALLGVLLATSGCNHDDSAAPAAGDTATAADAATSQVATCSGAALFGLPNDKTGLSSEDCEPTCSCGGTSWTPAPWTAERLADLRSWTLQTPFAEVTADPYLLADLPVAPTGTVCAVRNLGNRSYALQTYANASAAEAADAVPSHDGACGVCSTLHDLAVYAERPDLTDPVRQCGLVHLGAEMSAHVQCLQDLGFTLPCAQIWYWNTLHTRQKCAEPCFAALGANYHLPDGRLNDCLICDEVQSGPVFKAVAGRNRRNTGVPSSMCRPCSEVTRFDHQYQ